jgi:hypothetical protein
VTLAITTPQPQQHKNKANTKHKHPQTAPTEEVHSKPPTTTNKKQNNTTTQQTTKPQEQRHHTAIPNSTPATTNPIFHMNNRRDFKSLRNTLSDYGDTQ